MSIEILSLSPDNYRKHAIHGEGRDWAETNCYVDLWIELLHAMGHEPTAALPVVFSIDFEGDQWTFFKFLPEDIDQLFGLRVQELNIWRDLLACIEEQTGRGNHTLVEVDSFYLPDTQGTAYKSEHTKTTIAINKVDRGQCYLEYFHNQGYFKLQGFDVEQLFLATQTLDARVLPPYVEFVKPALHAALKGNALIEASLQCFRRELLRMPKTNPFLSFRDRIAQDFSDLNSVDIEFFHKYAFATLRQYGAAFELCRTYLDWLQTQGYESAAFTAASQAYGAISASS